MDVSHEIVAETHERGRQAARRHQFGGQDEERDRFYSGLTPEEQKVVEKGVEIAKIIHRGMTAAQDMNAPTMLSDVGMTVTPLTPAQVDKFRQLAQPAVRTWVEEQIGKQWVDKLFSAIEEYKKTH